MSTLNQSPINNEEFISKICQELLVQIDDMLQLQLGSLNGVPEQIDITSQESIGPLSIDGREEFPHHSIMTLDNRYRQNTTTHRPQQRYNIQPIQTTNVGLSLSAYKQMMKKRMGASKFEQIFNHAKALTTTEKPTAIKSYDEFAKDIDDQIKQNEEIKRQDQIREEYILAEQKAKEEKEA